MTYNRISPFGVQHDLVTPGEEFRAQNERSAMSHHLQQLAMNAQQDALRRLSQGPDTPDAGGPGSGLVSDPNAGRDMESVIRNDAMNDEARGMRFGKEITQMQGDRMKDVANIQMGPANREAALHENEWGAGADARNLKHQAQMEIMRSLGMGGQEAPAAPQEIPATAPPSHGNPFAPPPLPPQLSDNQGSQPAGWIDQSFKYHAGEKPLFNLRGEEVKPAAPNQSAAAAVGGQAGGQAGGFAGGMDPAERMSMLAAMASGQPYDVGKARREQAQFALNQRLGDLQVKNAETAAANRQTDEDQARKDLATKRQIEELRSNGGFGQANTMANETGLPSQYRPITEFEMDSVLSPALGALKERASHYHPWLQSDSTNALVTNPIQKIIPQLLQSAVQRGFDKEQAYAEIIKMLQPYLGKDWRP